MFPLSSSSPQGKVTINIKHMKLVLFFTFVCSFVFTQMDSGLGNTTLSCQDRYTFDHKSIWHSGNPLDSPTSLLFLQVFLITMATQLLDFCLKPLGQPSLVSQILGGVVFGPSVLGHQKLLANIFFPIRGSAMLETMTSFGLMFFYFICCMKMDPASILKTEKKAIVIGLSVHFSALIIPSGVSILLSKYVPMDQSLSDTLQPIVFSQASTVFISISVLMTELKILNTDIGRLTLSSVMFADIVGLCMAVIVFAILENKGTMLTLLCSILSVVTLFIVVVCVMRPTLLWILKRLNGKPIDEFCIICIFLFVLLTGVFGELIGQHFAFGPMILGLSVPEGPPLGTALTTKMETIFVAFLYPLYIAVAGLNIDIFKLSIQSIWIVTIVVLVIVLVKIGAVFLSGYFFNVPMKDCFIIGLLLNGRGISELSVYLIWRGNKMLKEQEFSLMVISIMAINFIIAPLIKFLHDPSKTYYSGRCAIEHTKPDSELRVMVCIYNNENIPMILNILEASYASMESNVAVIALILKELHGRSRPILVAHQPHDTLQSSTMSNSNHIDNALIQYAQLNQGYASVQSFTSISDFATIHEDVCRISLDGRANIVIMPFHKRWEIDGTVQVTNRAIKNTNIKVLEKAPCSVGILIDRGILTGSTSLLMAKATYHVVVLFTGGADDAEALAYGSRMGRHECVRVTVVRFLIFGEENSKDRRHDSDLVNEYRYHNAGNHRFEIIDEVIKDGMEMTSYIRRLIDYFDLVMVGREHPESVLFKGLDQWSEFSELGVIGDMLASQDFETKASVLVVQQQRIGGRFVKHPPNPVPNKKDLRVNDVPSDEILRASCTISMDNNT